MIGLSLGISSSVVSEAGVAIEDYVFDLVGGELTPRTNITSNQPDFSDVWEAGLGEITLDASPTSEGYFDIDGNGDVQPIA
tara:strand:- start:125 stop:367 length:243 start_codon:yes stop_codon:yes gene_type:complete